MQITELTEFEHFDAVAELQRTIWGMADLDVVSPNLMRVYCDQKMRWGILLGAWEASRLVGFLFCTPTAAADAVWMDLLGVLSDFQGRGIGRRLMERLAALARERGIRRALWTFDPLEAANANLYINKIGAQVQTYEEDYYRFAPSRIETGIPGDRFKVEWLFDASERTPQAENVPNECLRIEIPGDFRAIKRRSLEEALRWRKITRDQFRRIAAEGYAVKEFQYDRSSRTGAYLLCPRR